MGLPCAELALISALLCCTHAMTRQGRKLGFISRRDFCSGVCSALVGVLEPARADFVQSSEAVSLSACSRFSEWSSHVRSVRLYASLVRTRVHAATEVA